MHRDCTPKEWCENRTLTISEGITGLRLDKSAAVGSAHVVGFLNVFCQPAYTPCHLHAQESQQYQGLERRRLDGEFCP